MNRLLLLGLLFVTVFGSGCASTAYTTGGKTALKQEMPPPGKSKVLFVRPSQFLGEAIAFHVHDGDHLIGVLPGTSFFVYECEPGNHLFSASMEDLAMLAA